MLFPNHHEFERFHHWLIKEVMTHNPITCSPQDTLALAMGKMARHHIGQLPVVDGSELVGLVSIGDLVKSLSRTQVSQNQLELLKCRAQVFNDLGGNHLGVLKIG